MTETVKYHNDLNTVIMKKWTSEEMNFFFSIVAKAKDKGTQELVFNTDDLKELVEFDPKNYKRWANTMSNVADKIIDLKYKERTTSTYEVMSLFQYFKVDLDQKQVTVQVSPRFEYILNQLKLNFTYYRLEELIQIRSTYAKTMYRLLKSWKKKGSVTYKTEELKEILDIPDSYNASSINRAVIKPIEKELSQFFNNFKITPIKAKKKGTPIIKYEFTWTPEKTGEFVDYSQRNKKNYSKELTPKWINNESQTVQKPTEEEIKATQKLLEELKES